MKAKTLVILIAAIALALFLFMPNLSWVGDDGGAIHKSKRTVQSSEKA